MSTNSGLKGVCDVRAHANNEHSTAPCPAKGCNNRWKRCQVTGGCFNLSNNWSYRMCYACKTNPATKTNLDFGSPRQKDITQRQKDDYQNTGSAGGDTSTGE